MARILLLGLWLLCLFLVPPVARAEDDKPPLKVGYYENEIFQEGATEGAIKKGYAYEYYRKLSEYTGWGYEYVYGSYADLYKKLLAGEVDLLAGLSKTPEREGSIGYPALPMGSETYNLLKHAGDESITSAYDTLGGRRIGVLDSVMEKVLARFLAEHGLEAETVVFKDYQDMLVAFEKGSVELVVAESYGTSARKGAEPLHILGGADYYLCVSAKRPDILRELDEAQDQLAVEEPNFLNALRVKYYPDTISSRALSKLEKEWLKENKVLRLGYISNWLPYSYRDEQGEVAGFVRDFIPEMLSELGLKGLELEYVPFENYMDMIIAARNREVDAIFPIGGDTFFSEQNDILQSNGVLSAYTELIYRGDYREDLTDNIAISSKNPLQHYYAKKYFPEARLTYYPSLQACLEAVQEGRASCTVMDGTRAGAILKNRRYRNLSQKLLGNPDDRFFGVRLGSEGLLKLLNRGLETVSQEKRDIMAYKYVKGLYAYGIWDLLLDNLWLPALLAFTFALWAVWYFSGKAARLNARMEHITATLSEAIDAKDKYTQGHSGRVAAYAKEIARRLGYSRERQDAVYMMGLLHDVGKIGVPDAVISKPGRLTDEEFALIKTHPKVGQKILNNIREMPTLSAGARWHHERYDGRGYPDGKAGEEIPEEARIIAVADSYDAMSSCRSYRKALPQEKVRSEIEKGAGSQFDPRIAKVMLEMIDEDKEYRMKDHPVTET